MPKVSDVQQAPKIQKLATHSYKGKTKEDCISRFPDDILGFIISFLTMREGAKTSILSRRWRKLFSMNVSRRSFDDDNLNGYMYPSGYFRVNDKELCIESARTHFLRWGDQIWQSIYHASAVNALRVCFPLGKESASHVDKWMKLAAAQGVTQLDLDFNVVEFLSLDKDFNRAYRFSVEGFGSSICYLSLRFCVFDFPPDFKGFRSLISLSLIDMRLTNNTLQNVLSNCPSLEWLCLRFCKFSSPTILKFLGPSILLKHLAIHYCNIKGIEMHDVNLLSFELGGCNIKLSIENAPRLARLVLTTKGPVALLKNVPCLNTLFLRNQSSKLMKLGIFDNLKKLVYSPKYYGRNLLKVVCFLEACPLLQQLVIDMGIYRPQRVRKYVDRPIDSERIKMRPGCPHGNLKEVVIYGFDCHLDLIELAKYLLRNGTVLEKMKIYTTSKFYRGNGRWVLSKHTEIEGHLKKVHYLLRKAANTSTTQIILCSNQ